MADEELHDHSSPGPADSNSNCLRLLAQDTQRVFRIPNRTVLDMLLAYLGLSPAVYKSVVHEDGKIRVIVFFSTSTLDPKGPINDISMPGDYCTDNDTAGDTAAIRAIRYIEDRTNTVVRGVNLATSKRHQRHADRLRQELKESRTNSMQLARGRLLAVRHLHYFSVHIRNAVAMDYSVGNLPDMMVDINSRLEGYLEERSP